MVTDYAPGPEAPKLPPLLCLNLQILVVLHSKLPWCEPSTDFYSEYPVLTELLDQPNTIQAVNHYLSTNRVFATEPIFQLTAMALNTTQLTPKVIWCQNVWWNFGPAKTDLLGEQKLLLSDQGVSTVLQKSNIPSTWLPMSPNILSALFKLPRPILSQKTERVPAVCANRR